MSTVSHHRPCPNCHCNLDGGDILQTFLDRGDTPEKARETANLYGYDKGHTRWGREIGISENDRVARWKCPDCGHEWQR